MFTRQVTTEEIRDLAYMTIGQSHNNDWMNHRYGKRTSSKFARAINVMRHPQPTNIQHLREDINDPKNLGHVPAIM